MKALKKVALLPLAMSKRFRVFAYISISLLASMLITQRGITQEVIGTVKPLVGIGTPKPYAPATVRWGLAWTDTIKAPGASFIKLKFSSFQLGVEDYIVVRDLRNRHREILKNDKGREFWAVSVLGDKAIIELVSNGISGGPGFDISEIGIGYPPPDTCCHRDRMCGPDVECRDSIPKYVYSWKNPVCEYIYVWQSDMYGCTGWVITTTGAIITNNHCTPGNSWQTGECWFNYEAVECGSSQHKSISQYSVNNLECSNSALDYSILSVNPVLPETKNPVDNFGMFRLRRFPSVALGEPILVFHHSKALCQKQYSGGIVTATSFPNYPPVAPESLFESSALIRGGASGSPIIDDSRCVVGLLRGELVSPSYCNTNVSVKITSILADPAFAI